MDPWLLAGSVLGIALLVAMNWALGHWQGARIDDGQAAAARYARDHWDDRIDDVVVDRSGRLALLWLNGGAALGLVQTLGDRMVTRRLTADALRSPDRSATAAPLPAPPATALSERSGAPTLHLRIADLSRSRYRLVLDDRAEAVRWADRLDRMAAAAADRPHKGASGAPPGAGPAR
ncbi:hypothetical protein EV659_10613 [Rhodothalassium salexigens DSM 2132]|uniref:Uncharacterized protein n=1 Tax=Rhodothalassium salexigens DSM 2132 TaxID=1188247 RepID=A0A4R2PIT5_RHOSA|nr:hypothetical protein [Rhodothalassium salexigens]MBB4211849.1 hypothetical protein [Rhodothalassium salexigens DSM 2132]MBK1638854.1 hypothetical protein [Rhodothalassium salexigens DSM 2132]TCP33855.1 hypothetical protein EV659_10613 [Rhodothalassium salexigens DSM 2132]